MKKHGQDVINAVCALKKDGKSHRDISEAVFGVRSKASTVYDLLAVHYYPKAYVKVPEKAPKVLLLDIETAPAVSYHWGRWKVNVAPSQVISRPYLITWAAKWLDSKLVSSDMLPAYEGFEENPQDDYPILVSIWNLLDKADVVIGHYIKKFDLPQLYARFAYHGMPKPSPYKVICTKEMASKHFKFEANSLEELTEYFGVGSKGKMSFEDWKNCVDGVGTAEGWLKMLDYNERDVIELEKVYYKMRHYDSSHPNMSLFFEDPTERCTVCGSKDVEKLDKKVYTIANAYDSYRCNCCSHIMRDRFTTAKNGVKLTNSNN